MVCAVLLLLAQCCGAIGKLASSASVISAVPLSLSSSSFASALASSSSSLAVVVPMTVSRTDAARLEFGLRRWNEPDFSPCRRVRPPATDDALRDFGMREISHESATRTGIGFLIVLADKTRVAETGFLLFVSWKATLDAGGVL